jgi:hypothetical protein
MPPDKASNHHYRQCRKEWQVKVKDKQNKLGNLTKCDAFERFTSYDMIILANAIEKNVLRVISELKLTKR